MSHKHACMPGCPKILCTDPGTENSVVAVIQPVLRHNGTDYFAGSNSHRYGKSPANQVYYIILSVTDCIIQRF